MTSAGSRFTVLQRALHWLMAICILAMLFIGVGMRSTVTPKYPPLLAAHKTLGIAMLVLALIRLAVRLATARRPAGRSARADEARGAAVALRALRADDRNAAARLGHAVGRPPIRSCCIGSIRLPPIFPRATPAHGAVERAFLSGFRIFRPDPAACRGGVVPCARPARRRVREHGAHALAPRADWRQGSPGRMRIHPNLNPVTCSGGVRRGLPSGSSIGASVCIFTGSTPPRCEPVIGVVVYLARPHAAWRTPR